MIKRLLILPLLFIASCAQQNARPPQLLAEQSQGETFTVAMWNIENFHSHFTAFHLGKAEKPAFDLTTDEGKELLRTLKNANDEDNWEAAQVILHPTFNPDVLVIEECCTQSDLEYFNKRWLNGAYETVIVFPSNTDRNQHLGLLAKKGFKVIERKDQYHLEKDSVANARGDKLFARGPAFAKMQTPGGYNFWVGVNHQKSKSQNSLASTQWRNREAVRTHQIIKELEKTGPDDVIYLGDMNDTIGPDQFESKPDSGGDAMTNLTGLAEDGFFLATKSLADAGKISYHGYWKTEYRSMIDHIIMTRAMKDQLLDVHVVNLPLVHVASDHYPVITKIRADAPAK